MSAWRPLVTMCVVVLCPPAVVGGASGAPKTVSDVWQLDLDASPWRDWAEQIPLALRPHHPVFLDGPDGDPPNTAAPHELVPREGALGFRVVGRAGKRRDMRWTRTIEPLDCSAVRYCVLRYRAEGIRRQHGEPRPVVELIQTDEKGSKVGAIHLLDCQQAVNDGLSHVLIGRVEDAGSINGVEVLISTQNSHARVVIEAIELHKSPPADAQGFGRVLTEGEAMRPDFVLLDISSQFNDTLAAAFDRSMERFKAVIDGTRQFRADVLEVGGVPFRVHSDGNSIIRPSGRNPSDGLTEEFLGETLSRNDFRPISRDATVSVLVGRKTREVHFLLASELPVTEFRYGVPKVPFRIDDTELFLVELVYADGESDLAFPYSVADEGYVLSRALGAYAVAVDPERELDEVVFHSRVIGSDFSLAAVSLNVSPNSVLPVLTKEPPRPEKPRLLSPEPTEPHIDNRDGRLVCGNSHYEITLNCRQGFSIERIVNRAVPDAEIALHPSSGLAVELEGSEITVSEHDQLVGADKKKVVATGSRILTGRAFRTRSVDVSGTEANIALVSEDEEVPLAIRITVSVDGSEELALGLHLENKGDTPLKTSVRFPALNRLTIGSVEDTWIFFPKYRTVLTNERRFVRSSHGLAFSAPFFDAFSPSAGVGVMVLTRNLDMMPVHFDMAKNDQGVNCAVEYTGYYHTLPPKGTFDALQSRLIPHTGDWHRATEIYRDWKDTWFKADRAKNADWFEQSFLLRCHISTATEARRIQRTRPFFDKEAGVFHLAESLEADKKYWGGLLPDIFHFYGWHYRDDIKEYAWGDFTLPEVYDRVGGLTKFRQAVDTLQTKHGIPVSLYTLGDRASSSTEASKRFKDPAAITEADGSTRDYPDFRLLCSGYQPWQDHYINEVVKLQSDTGAKAIYLDVFPRGNTCHDEKHGHELPLWPERLNHEMIQRLRDEMPDSVALFAEYPFGDVSAQYADGFLTYYNLDLEDHFGPSFDLDERARRLAEAPFALNRYLFPGLKQFAFPCGISYHNAGQQKIPFLNGDAIYDNTWWLRCDRMQAVLIRALKIQRAYTDCFMTGTPRPRIPTQKAGIVANAFPTETRTVWTLYNTRYRTWRGESLSVEHRAGSRYHDAWNDQDLEPEIRDGRAILSVPLDPQGLGCIVQETGNAAD